MLTIKRNNMVLAFFVVGPLIGAVKVYTAFRYMPLLFDAAFAFYLLSIVECVKKFRWNHVATIVLMLALIGVAELFNPYYHDMVFKLEGFRQSVFYMLAFFIPLTHQLSEDYHDRFVRLNLAVGCVVAIVAIKQWAYPFSAELAYASLEGVGSHFYGDTYARIEDYFRVFGTMVSSTHLAAFMLWTIFLSLGVIFYGEGGKRLAWCSAALGVFTLSLTFSRTAILAFLLGLGFFILVSKKHITGGRWVFAVAIGAVAVALTAVLLMLAVPLFFERMTTVADIEKVSSLLSRFDLWGARIADIKKAPEGYGTGLAGFHDTGSYHLIADNQFLKVFIEWGWAGGALFIFVLLFQIVMMFRDTQRLHSYRAVVINIAVLCFVISMLPMMMTGQILEAFPINFLFWYLMGFVSTFKHGGRLRAEKAKELHAG